jgi:hypothetical protein
MNLFLITLYGFFVGVIILLLFFIITRKEKDNYKSIQPKYKGMCIFDIDQTLTTGTENYKVVQKCIDNNYAVGISTAGGMYKPSNLSKFEWMPINLYNFMENTKFITFNNVRNFIAAGQYDPIGYSEVFKLKRSWGWLKGYSLLETAKALNITDYKKIILFDNDPGYIEGCKQYNSDINIVCSGEPCGDVLSTKTLDNIVFY